MYTYNNGYEWYITHNGYEWYITITVAMNDI